MNPDVVRTKLISAGLFLIGHEMLLDTIKRHPLAFFADQWTRDGPQPSAKYTSEILARDLKGKNDALRGSIAWLRMMDAITVDDEASIRAVTDARNDLAHEMTAMVDGSKPPEFANQFTILMALVQKIEKWWIVNVEIPTNPDFDSQEIDEDEIISGPSWVMQMLSRVALGIGDEAWEFHREFVKQRAGVSE
ncbi:hypothetical protein G5C33_18340 [Sphingosinithalassobacter tenebrarum]|uniref:Uncharacterized protein n=1 Tax=Stakelama tenebrarum TaxID=2711215 RepID=A0A6G6Y9D6_9SPHN|nr:hypothetical protein G5C33_18340 [Sphingosinithalassobacter tenebrarum]